MGRWMDMNVLLCPLPDQLNKADLQALMPLLSRKRKDRIERFLHIEDAFRSLIGDLLVAKMFSIEEPGQMEIISTNDYGKPYFPEFPHCQFNVSHSGSWIACAAHHSEVGIDIEKHKAMDVHIAKQLFTAEEWMEIKEQEDTLRAFYDLWTRKESYIKAVGKGLSIPLDSFQVEGGKAPVHVCSEMDVSEYRCYSLPIEPGYSMAVCAKHAPDRGGDIFMQQTTFDSLARSFHNI